MEWVDVTRGFAVFLVIFYHVVIALNVTHTPPPAWAVTLNDALAPFRIPVLMFCSGLLLARSLSKPPKQYLNGKLRHIGWPYLVWTLVIVTFLVGGSNVAGNGNYGAGRIASIVTDPATYTWYLAYLLLFYLIALVVPARARTWAVPILLVVSAVFHDGDGWTRLTFLLAFFFLGDVATRHRAVWMRLVRHRGLLVLAGALAVGTAVASTRLGLRYDLWAAFGVAGVALLAVPVGSRVARTWLGDRIASIGRDSIVYYTTHWIVVTAGIHLAGRLRVEGGTVLTLGLLVLGVGVSYLLVLLKRRYWLFGALYVFPSRFPFARRRGV
jgi:uncharacterized membrane protein YcfT